MGFTVVTKLHHKTANVGQADAFLGVVFVELIVDVVGIRVAEQSLGLSLLRLVLGHRLSGQVDRAGHPVERQVQHVQFLASVLVAQHNGSLRALAIRGNLIEHLV